MCLAWISPLALIFLLAVIEPVTLKLSLNEIIGFSSPTADLKVSAYTIPLALISPLAVIFLATMSPKEELVCGSTFRLPVIFRLPEFCPSNE